MAWLDRALARTADAVGSPDRLVSSRAARLHSRLDSARLREQGRTRAARTSSRHR
jgi:hypothetical protein